MTVVECCPPCVGADDFIGPPAGPAGGLTLVYRHPLPAAMWGGRFRPPRSLAAPQAFRDDASIVPYETRGKALPGFAGYFHRKAAMHPFVCALRRIHLPLQGRLLGDCRLKGSPARGAVGKAD